MSNDFGFVGEINRQNAAGAVADTMNELNTDILAMTMEMGGKQIAKLNGEVYAVDNLSSAEVEDLKADAVTYEKVDGPLGTEYFVGWGGEPLELNGIPINYTDDLSTLTDDQRAMVENHAVRSTELWGQGATQTAVLSLLGIDADNVSADKTQIQVITTPDGGVQMLVKYTESDTKDTKAIGIELNDEGVITKMSPVQKQADIVFPGDLKEVESNGLLASWGIDAEDLNPGDLFFIQQQLQIVKDTISTVHTTGKTQGDVMREATQKFAQG